MWRRIFDVFFWLGLATYFGGMVLLGPIVAPSIFQTVRTSHISMPGIAAPPLTMDGQVGGELFGDILNRFAYVETIALALMLLGLGGFLFVHLTVRRSTWLLLALWLFVSGITAYESASLYPEVWSLRQNIRNQAATRPAASSNSAWPERDRFDALHARATLLGSFKAYTLLVMLLVTAWRSGAKPRMPGDATPRNPTTIIPRPGDNL